MNTMSELINFYILVQFIIAKFAGVWGFFLRRAMHRSSSIRE